MSYLYKRNGFSIKNISLSLFQNEFAAITGPNGSGKTTLGKISAGILKPDSGQVLIDGNDSRDISLGQIGCKIGYLFQNPDRQIFSSSVRDEISFAMEIKGYPDEEIKKKTDEMLDIFNLKNIEGSLPFRLSRGEKQRLALAAILVNEPKFLILDEPTTGLDMVRKEILSDIIRKLRNRGLGMAVISHDEQFISCHADRVIMLSGGEIKNDIKKTSGS